MGKKRKITVFLRLRIACVKALLTALVFNSILLAAVQFIPSDYLASWLKADILFSLTIRPPETYSDPSAPVAAPSSPSGGSGGGYREPLPWSWSASSSRKEEETPLKESAPASAEEPTISPFPTTPFLPVAEQTAEVSEEPTLFPAAPSVVNPAPSPSPVSPQTVGFPSSPSSQPAPEPTAPSFVPSPPHVEKTDSSTEDAPPFVVTVERKGDSFFKELLVKVQVALMAGLFVISASLLLI